MYELRKIGKVVTSKFVGTGPSYYKKRIYWAAVSQRLRNPDLETQQWIGRSPNRAVTSQRKRKIVTIVLELRITKYPSAEEGFVCEKTVN